MSLDIADEINIEIKKIQSPTQLHLVILSGNNLRHGDKCTAESVVKFYHKVTGLIQKHATKDIKLVYAGIIPSPLGGKIQKQFIAFDQLLQAHCCQNKNTHFFNSDKVFSFSGTTERSFYEHDNIDTLTTTYLNSDGINLYRSCLVNYLQNTFTCQ